MFNFRERNDQAVYQLSQDMADMYLTKNGLPITNAQNTQYKGASKDIYDIFTDRDPRMYHTVTPPYSVIQGGTDKPAETLTAAGDMIPVTLNTASSSISWRQM